MAGSTESQHVKKKTLFSRSCSIKGANDMRTLLDRNIYIFHSRAQTAVSASQGNFETRWSLSHTKHHEKNRRGRRKVGARGIWDKCWCTWQFSMLGVIGGGLLTWPNTPPCSHGSYTRSCCMVLSCRSNSFVVCASVIRMSKLLFPGRVVKDEGGSSRRGSGRADSTLTL